MYAHGYLSTSCHRCLEIDPFISRTLLSINFCACAKYGGPNLEGTQSHEREGNKRLFVNIYCLGFSENFFLSPISGNYIPPFFLLEIARLSSPSPKGKVKVLTK